MFIDLPGIVAIIDGIELVTKHLMIFMNKTMLIMIGPEIIIAAAS